jgi:hypothetical protein
MCVVVSDFRHGAKFVPYHADLIAALSPMGWELKGITILTQNHKKLYPYGYPYAFVSNIHHQYILVFQKGASSCAIHYRCIIAEAAL